MLCHIGLRLPKTILSGPISLPATVETIKITGGDWKNEMRKLVVEFGELFITLYVHILTLCAVASWNGIN